MIDQTRFESALLWAIELHLGQTRKQTPVPYHFHLLSVASLVAEGGGDENQVIAALLHDAVEDAGGPRILQEIRARYGDEVAEIVDVCTDTDEDPKPPWRPRKEAFLRSLPRANPRAYLVIASDKLHNARCTVYDLRHRGPEIWKQFRGGRDGTLWYLGEVVRTLRQCWDHPTLGELERTVQELSSLAR